MSRSRNSRKTRKDYRWPGYEMSGKRMGVWGWVNYDDENKKQTIRYERRQGKKQERGE